jgi:hypothetical protein
MKPAMKSPHRAICASIAFSLLVLGSMVAAPTALAVPINVRGLMDVAVRGDDDMQLLNRQNTGDSFVDPVRTRLFLSGTNGQSQAHLQFLLSADSRSEFRVFGAYLLHKIWEDREVFVEAGRIPIHDGAWASRTYSDKNPLIGIPLAYYWHSTLSYRMMPADLAALVAQRGGGQAGVFYADADGPRGTAWSSAPMLYDNCWDQGLFVLGKQGKVEYSLGTTVGAPSSPVKGTDTNDNLAIHAKLGFAVGDWMKTRVSYAAGAYLWDDVAPYLPAGKSVNDYYQRLWVLSTELSRDRYLLHAEFFANHYETPLRADGLGNRSFYLEGCAKLWPGSYVTVRYEELSFEEVQSGGENLSWDQNVRRIEAGAGYNVSRELRLKAVVQMYDLGSGFASETAYPAVQASLKF